MAALELAERALRHLDGDGQATVTGERSLTLRFAASSPTQATEVDDLGVQLTAVRDGHVGTATTNLLDDDALRAAARRAIDAAEAARRAKGGPGDHPGLPAPTAYPTRDGCDAVTARLDPEPGGEALRRAFAVTAERGLGAFGVWTSGVVETAIASSEGVRAHDVVTDAFLKVIARRDDGRSGWGAQAATAVGALDADAVARRAAGKVPPGEPAEVAPGTYPVVLEPDAVGGLLELLSWVAFNGLAHAEGRGALSGRLGALVAAPAITLTDDPDDPRTYRRGFDLEGAVKSPMPLIHDGVARAVAHDARSAARAGGGTRSTGHALAPGGTPGGPVPTNLVLAGGDAADEQQLVAPIERGIYVTRFWYLNVVHPQQSLVTGTTRDGTFLIEDGRITRPLRDLRITESVLALLERTEALTAVPRLVTEAEHYGRRFATGTVTPGLRASGLRITG